MPQDGLFDFPYPTFQFRHGHQRMRGPCTIGFVSTAAPLVGITNTWSHYVRRMISQPTPHPCPLCHTFGAWFFEDLWLTCPECRGLFRPSHHFPTVVEERSRYAEHQNDVHDERFRAFVSPITEHILADHHPGEEGLDFGSGIAPIVWHVLSEAGFKVEAYDPLFSNQPQLLEGQYDYITCCEVIEHFHRPGMEFQRLKNMLKSGGKLYCMTILHHEGIDFKNWHYRRDDTHVFVYQRETIAWIAERFGFSRAEIEGRLIVFDR